MTFGLRTDDIHVDYDLSELVRADIVARYNGYRTGIMSGFLSPNEARIDDGRDPKTGKETGPDALQQPTNMSAMGSQSSGTGADGGGRPEDGTVANAVAAAENAASAAETAAESARSAARTTSVRIEDKK